MRRRDFIAGVFPAALIHGSSAKAAFANFMMSSSGGSGNQTFSPININGGGYVTGVDVANDGTKVVRVDVNNCYLMVAGGTTWVPLITAASMPQSFWGFSNGDSGGTYAGSSGPLYGPYEIRIAPSNSQRLYMLWQGLMFTSGNQGATWIKMSNFPSISWSGDSNGNSSRINQRKMAIDPINPDVVLIGTPSNGVYACYNGTSGATATFTPLSGITTPTSRNGIAGISFDASSGTITTGPASPAAQTTTMYAGSSGNGVYTSTNGGATWVAAGSGSPTSVVDGVANNGRYFAAYSGGIELFVSGAWSNIYSAYSACAVDVNPSDSTWLIMMVNFGVFEQGVVIGTTFTSSGTNSGYWYEGPNPTVPPSDTGWLANTRPGYPSFTNEPNWSSGGLRFDPSHTARACLTWGYGFSFYDIPSKTLTGTTPMAWTTNTAGIQNMVTTDFVSQAGYNLLIGVEYQGVFYLTSLTTPPSTSTAQLGDRSTNCATWCMDASQTVPGLVCVLSSGYYLGPINYSGFSTNGGATWTQFPTQPFSSDGGQITCGNSALVFVAVLAGASKTPVITRDGGNTWSALSGAPAAQYVIGGNPPSNNPHLFTNDANGDIYFIAPGHGLYKVSASSSYASAVLVNSQDVIDSAATWLGANRAAPGQAGVLFCTPGFLTSGPYPDSSLFYKTTNGGTSWTSVPNVKTVWRFGFGQPYPGYTTPTTWFVGFANDGSGYIYGLWRSRDLCVSDLTWIIDWPAGHVDTLAAVSGDMNNYQNVYLGYNGSTAVWGTGIT